MNLSDSSTFFPYRPAAWLRVSGSDAASFLQGQFTNDVKGLAAHQSIYGLWLDHKGKITADSFIIAGATAGEFWIASYFCPGEEIRGRLERFIIADDVVVEDLTSAWAGVSVIGAAARGQLPAGAPSVGIIFPGRRSGAENWEWIFPLGTAPDPISGLAGRTEMSAAEIEHARISAGIPAVPRDLGPNDLPNEGGLAELAVSYTKGCYVGQEVMARLKSRGRLRRQLVQVRASVPIPALPAALWQENRAVGELRSAAANGSADGFVGLSLVTLASFRAGVPLAFSAAGPAVLTTI